MQHGDAVFGEQARQRFRIACGFFRAEPERRADQIRNPDLFERHVEGDREALVDTVVRTHAQHRVLAAQEVADAALVDQDAFRLAGRPRRVDHVGRRAPRDRAAALEHVAIRCRQQQVLGHVDGLGNAAEALAHPLAGHERRRTGVRHADQQALGRGVFVDREPGGAGLGDRRLHDQQVDPAWHPQADDIAWPDAGFDQARGGQAGLLVEFAVAELAGAGHKGGFIGRTLRAGFEQVGQDFIAQQLGLVGSVQDVGVLRRGNGIFHRHHIRLRCIYARQL